MPTFVCTCVFQLSGVVIMGFGLWLLLDNQSFIVVLSKFLHVCIDHFTDVMFTSCDSVCVCIL